MIVRSHGKVWVENVGDLRIIPVKEESLVLGEWRFKKIFWFLTGKPERIPKLRVHW